MRFQLVRSIFVSLITFLAVALPAPAQQPQNPAPKPRPTYGPNSRMQDAVLRNIRGMPASLLDKSLPPLPLDQWLFITLAPHLRIHRASFADWRVTICDDPESAIPGPGPVLCVEVEAPIDAERTLHVELNAGEFVWTSGGNARWEQRPPSLHDIYIDGHDGELPANSLDVASLAELKDSLEIARADWPASDLQTTITWTPQVPPPGGKIDITIVVSNKGKRGIDRVHVNVLVSPCCPQRELRYDWFPRVDAGESVRLTASVVLPDGFAMAVASATPIQSPKRVVDANAASKMATVVMIGEPR